MAPKVNPKPQGYHTVTPSIVVQDGAKALEFYKKAFGAEQTMLMPGPGGSVMHAEIRIGDSHVMLADESPGMGHRSAQSIGATPVSLVLYVEDVDAQFKQAIAAGAKELRPVEDQFYGDRMGTLVDPFGHVWSLGTHKEDVSPEEMNRRMAEMMAQKA